MDEQQESYFNELHANRVESAKALDGFALRGVRNTVVEKYSDQAHFIYELLQNADDAKATSARFELFEDKLIFAHDGSRRFTVSDPSTEDEDRDNGRLGDINAITAVGASNKTGEETIGKFGVGFKAVFQYSATPHIYDPNVFFKIEKFIVPIRVETDYTGRGKDETLFVFPFDHDKRTKESAYSDISEKLRSLDYPLLFLSNLKDISFVISGKLGLYGKIVEETWIFDNTIAELVRLTQNDGENVDDLYDDMLWLFSRDDSKGNKYSVGFFIDAEGRLIPTAHTAFCFFPTREVTELNFILHAPFLLTDSREGIRAGAEHNTIMIDLLSKLAADSLLYLREIGSTKKVRLIDEDIFDIVPYDESRFTEFSKNRVSFKPFYTSIKEAFKKEALIPSRDGYVTSDNAYWAEVPRIAELFSGRQLGSLSGNASANWVFNTFGRQDTLRKNKPLTAYIDSITEVWLDEDDVLNGWSTEEGNTYSGITGEFIESQSIEWLHEFYKWLSETDHRTEISKTKPIFLNQQKKAVAAFDSKEQAILFLPTEGGSGYETILDDLLENETTQKFVCKIGIAEPSLRDEIYNIILPQYKDNTALDTRTHFKKFFKFYQEFSQSQVESFLKMIRECAFVMYESESDKDKCSSKPGDLYFPCDSLRLWFRSKPEARFVTFNEYLQVVGEDNREDLLKFFRDLGVKDLPRILSREISQTEAYEIRNDWEYSTRGQRWTEKCVDGCKELLNTVIKEKDSELSKLAWIILLRCVEQGYFQNTYHWAPDSVLYGKYEYFYHSSQSRSFTSSEAKRLTTQPWLVNRDGEFVSANEVTVQNMNPVYDVSSDEAKELCKLLGIKKEISEHEEEDISSFAESLGLSNEEQRQALLDFSERKRASEFSDAEGIEDFTEHVPESQKDEVITSVNRVIKEISKRATSESEESAQDQSGNEEHRDEDDYSKPATDIGKIIERVKEQAEREIKEIARLEDLKLSAQKAKRYSYSWFKYLLELECLNSSANNANSREISISFSKVEREEGTSRTLLLKHPSRYIPHSMEDLSDIPLELHFSNQPMIRVAVEVVNVKSYTLRAKLRTNTQIDGVDLSLVTEARIEARNPVFLIEELKRAFIKLGDDNGYDDDFNMQDNLSANIEFVFGPPGTGKTTYLARDIIVPLMRQSEDIKVLVLTPTNKAADVLMRRLMDIMGQDHSYMNWLIRFGVTNDTLIEQSGVFRDKNFDIRSSRQNVTVTTIARFPYDYFLPDNSTRIYLNGLKWDYIVIDEASMIPLANIVYPLYKKTPEKFIIAGDPFQIEPISTVDVWKNENIYTMVKLNSFTEPTTIPHKYHVKLLTTQYRSIPEIGEIFSQLAYGGVLKHNRTTDCRRVLQIGAFGDLKPLNLIKFPVRKYESIYRSKRLQSKSSYHVYSALFAFEFLKYLLGQTNQSRENKLLRIGLISPYRAQADLIDKLMVSVDLPKFIDIQVGTIHGFQGDECDIILALFNPPPTISPSNDMFLNNLNIVNVSISRARDFLFVLMPDDETENINNLLLIKRIEFLCKSQSKWSEQQAPIIEELILGSKTYLEDNSFSTSHQSVNVYVKPEKRYEVRSEDNAIDVQIHE